MQSTLAAARRPNIPSSPTCHSHVTPPPSSAPYLSPPSPHSSTSSSSHPFQMAHQWLHYPYHLPDHDQDDNSASVSDSTLLTTAATPTDGGRVAKPVRKRSRASRRTPTTLLNTDPANFRAMVQQFTGGPSHANNLHNFAAFGFPGNSHPVFDPPAAAYHLQEPTLFHFQNQPPPQQPPLVFSLDDSAAGDAFFQQAQSGGSRSNNSNVDYMGLYDGSSLAARNPRPA